MATFEQSETGAPGAVNRRRFLCLGIGAAALGGAGLYWRSRGLVQVSRTSRALGSEVSLTVLTPSLDAGELAIDAALAELELIENVMSLYRPRSELCRLNREGVLDNPHPHLSAVLREAQGMSLRSGGAFDPTVQPLWSLYADAKRAGRLPEASEIEQAKARVDWRRIQVSSNRITLHGDGTAVTLNGIAQGFAADRVLDVLRSHGIEHALVNTGELGATGHRADGDAWTIGIQHPRRADAYISLAQLHDRCLATSGDYNTKFTPDGRLNHVFDPRTGRSPEEFASVSVVAPRAVTADALSTALFVLGLEPGLQFVQATPGADALFVLMNGDAQATHGFPVREA